MASPSLTEALSTAADSAAGQGAGIQSSSGQGSGQAALSAPQGQGAAGTNQPAPSGAADGNDALSAGFKELGLGGEDDPSRVTWDGAGQGGEPSSKLELEIPADQVVGTLDGKPVTGEQLKNAVMAHSEFTRRSQEFAEYRTNADPAIQFVTQNAALLQEFASNDPQRIEAALIQVGKDYGIELGSAGKGNGARERDPATGRFSPRDKGETDAELSDIAEEYGKDSFEYKQAKRMAGLESSLAEAAQQNAALQQRHEKFTAGLQSAQQAAQARSELDGVLKVWGEKGVTGIDAEAAMSLVGQTITAAQAAQLAGFPQVVKWLVAKQTGRPNEPGTAARAPLDLKGKSLSDTIRERAVAFTPG